MNTRTGWRKEINGRMMLADAPDAPAMLLGDTPKQALGCLRYDKDLESQCRACKNEDTQRLGGFETYHHRVAAHLGHANFRAYHCQCCGADWWHLTKQS